MAKVNFVPWSKFFPFINIYFATGSIFFKLLNIFYMNSGRLKQKKSRHCCRDFPLLIIQLFNTIEHLCGYPTTFSCPRNRP